MSKQKILKVEGKTAVFIDYANMKSWLAQMGHCCLYAEPFRRNFGNRLLFDYFVIDCH